MECVNPIYIRKLAMHVRCGKCLACKEYAQKQWSSRLSIELKYSLTAYFITLTYDDEHIKYGYCDEKQGELWTLDKAIEKDDFRLMEEKFDKSDIQLFLKGLRNVVEKGVPKYYEGKKVSKIEGKGQKIKYYCVGERGEKFKRPHWHILLFNFPFNLEDSDNLVGLYWRNGFHKIGIQEQGSIEYTTDYMFKNDKNETIRLMSKGLGLPYVESKENVSYHQKTLDGIIRVNGKKSVLPKYLRNYIFNSDQKRKIADDYVQKIVENRLLFPMDQANRFNTLTNKVNYKKTKK